MATSGDLNLAIDTMECFTSRIRNPITLDDGCATQGGMYRSQITLSQASMTVQRQRYSVRIPNWQRLERRLYDPVDVTAPTQSFGFRLEPMRVAGFRDNPAGS